jgi:hypothetical protein
LEILGVGKRFLLKSMAFGLFHGAIHRFRLFVLITWGGCWKFWGSASGFFQKAWLFLLLISELLEDSVH